MEPRNSPLLYLEPFGPSLPKKREKKSSSDEHASAWVWGGGGGGRTQRQREREIFITQVGNTGVHGQGQAKKTIICFSVKVPEV